MISTMKKSMLIILTLITGMYAKAQFIKAELQASGLTCSMCSFATQKQLKTLSYVDSIGVNLVRKRFEPINVSKNIFSYRSFKTTCIVIKLPATGYKHRRYD